MHQGSLIVKQSAHQYKKRKYIPRKSGFGTRGKWSDQENVVYFKFLLEHHKDFQRPGQRKKNQVFLRMSKLLGTRTPDQCRSHHQKVQNYSKTKQVSGLCQFILDKLTYSPRFQELRSLLEYFLAHYSETPRSQSIYEQREKLYCLFGNDRGCISIALDIEGMGSW